MVIASPWTRGGWVNSQVFDHTSSIQFLERLVSRKFGKKIEEPNISDWRRTVCGDLTSLFRPYNDEKLANPGSLDRDEFVESIHKAQFKNPPSNYKRLTKREIEQINKHPQSSPFMPAQERGIRSSCALPYQLYADGMLSDDKSSFEVSMKAGSDFFGESSAGSPFHVYTPGKYKSHEMRNRAYAVAAGDELKDSWNINDFENGHYHLRVYGPNGFFREFSGDKYHSLIEAKMRYEQRDNRPTGNITLQITNSANQSMGIIITDNSYKAGTKAETIDAGSSKEITLDTSKAFGWYDVSIKLKDQSLFSRTYAGHVETGSASKTDPFMGRVV
jgi:phospholipase C